ncbi:hypothetical protein FEM54_25620 [Pseudomonas edaphica]|uniref:Bacteriocin n=1 Tax=Pseudomonas edaphica TaxID=2006980 RepID=A0ABY2TYD9_9PSED|nr:hypothetical protein [Pseudomonas edaphica]TLG88622.1 hypothetical protein FEM54_25620 [Pseudomonas edaphica]
MQNLNCKEIDAVSGAGIIDALKGLGDGLYEGTRDGAQLGSGSLGLGGAVASITVGVSRALKGFWVGLWSSWF